MVQGTGTDWKKIDINLVLVLPDHLNIQLNPSDLPISRPALLLPPQTQADDGHQLIEAHSKKW